MTRATIATDHGPIEVELFANDAPLFYQINADPRTGGPAQSKRNFRSTTDALFFQDDWKLLPQLTLNYGLRWEYYGRITEKNNKQSMWHSMRAEAQGTTLASRRADSANPIRA